MGHDVVQFGVVPGHAAQFYESEEFLLTSLERFLSAGLRAGQPCLVIARGSRVEDVRSRLEAQGFDLEAAERHGGITLLEAREMLTDLTVRGSADAAPLRAVLGGQLERLRHGRADLTVRVYCEIVDLLVEDDQLESALQVEAAWNELATVYSFSLLCAYAMSRFATRAQTREFERVCNQHNRVVPAESYSGAKNEDARLRAVSRLQQCVMALQHELTHREDIERSLRRQIADFKRCPA
jgi:hypothetical protein